MDTVIFTTPCGEIKGIDNGDYIELRGIEYAKAKRFEYPVQIEKWDGVYDATKFGACSYQHRGFEDDEQCNPFYHKEFRSGMTFEYSEDCLFLNIYAPKNAENSPVLIFIHGGSFTGGSTNEAHITGKEYAKNGVVFVDMNYRLGAFGFCAHKDLKTADGRCGNFGLYDQFTAIKWVKDNISSFGGNPDKITLMGQSAGAMSVDIHLSSPMCKNWFSGAVLLSGGALQRRVSKFFTTEKATRFWDKIISKAGVVNVEELKTVKAETLYFAWKEACREDSMSMAYTLPVCDEYLVNNEVFNMNTIPDIPYILGVTINDMVPAVLEMLTRSWVKHCKGHKNNCYVYNFNRALPGDDLGAWHASDLLYVFGTLDNNWRPFEKVDYEISNQVIKSICAFAKSGDPNCNAIPKWIAGYKKPMRFCESSASLPWATGTLIRNTFKKGPY